MTRSFHSEERTKMYLAPREKGQAGEHDRSVEKKGRNDLSLFNYLFK